MIVPINYLPNSGLVDFKLPVMLIMIFILPFVLIRSFHVQYTKDE
jgi:ligand-binding sensor protein